MAVGRKHATAIYFPYPGSTVKESEKQQHTCLHYASAFFLWVADAVRCLADTELKAPLLPEAPLQQLALAWLGLALRLCGGAPRGGQLGVLPRWPVVLARPSEKLPKRGTLAQDRHQAPLCRNSERSPSVPTEVAAGRRNSRGEERLERVMDPGTCLSFF